MPLQSSALAPAVVDDQGNSVSALTEDGSAIGGTNDGDLPDISTVSGTYTQAEVTAIRDAVRECAQRINDLVSHMNNGR